MRHSPVALAMVVLLVGLAGRVAGQEDRYSARLATVPIDFTTAAAVTGTGTVDAVLKGNKLSISGKFEGLGSPATIAQVRRGARGVRGPVVFDLTISHANSGVVSGSLDLKPNQIEDLKQGKLYVQIHSEKASDGNLWGWLLKPER